MKRGGNWNNNAKNCRSANRNNNNPNNENNNIGFRVASEVPEPSSLALLSLGALALLKRRRET